jgi:hypothetical protein
MGIRFTCPNGHKLNVKTFLAGRTGFCPYCGERVEIPKQSTRNPGKSGKGRGSGVGRTKTSTPTTTTALPPLAPLEPLASGPLSPLSDGAITTGPIDQVPAVANAPAFSPAPSVAAAPVAPVAPISPVANVAAVVPTAGPATDFTAQLEGLAVTSPASASTGLPDPLVEAPDAVWYVRPPSGGQFGPAAGSVMKDWLQEGRISGDSLVWREGWRDWQEAMSVFPQLAGVEMVAAAPAPTIVPPVASSLPRHTPAHKRRKSTATQVLIIGGLVVLVAALAVFFVWLIRGEVAP